MFSKTTNAFGMSFAFTAILSAVLVPVKELSSGVHAWMAALTGHHWVTHGVLQLVLFLALALILSGTGASRVSPATLTGYVVGALLAGSALIAGFFALA